MLTAVRMPTQEPASQFRAAVVEQTTTVQVGYLSKPMAASDVFHKEGIFIRVSSSLIAL